MWRVVTQNDLQHSNQAPADVAFTEPPPEIRDLLMKSASLVAKEGLEMEKRIMRSNEWNPDFNFLRSSDPFHAFYKLKVSECCALLNQDGPAQYIQPDTPAITREYVRVHRDPPQPRNPPIFVLTNPPEGITLKEIGIIMLTAQFVARYGMYFLAGLMKRVSMNPQFEFMRETDSCRCDYFTQLVVAYSRVLSPSRKLSERRLVCMETRFEDFFHHLQLEKLEEGVETAMSDLLAFVGVVDYFARMENGESSAAVPPPQHFSMLMNPPPQMQPAIPVTPPLGSKAQLPPPSMDDSVPVAQADVKIIKLPHDIRRMIEKTALLVSQEGLEIERRIKDCKVDDKIFNFLRSSDPYHGIYQRKVTEFRAWKQESDPDILPDIPSFLQVPIFPVGKPPEGITLKELDLMKLTALFSARYGMYFTMALMERGRVMTRNHFDFLEISDTRCCYFSRLVIAYSRVLRRTDKLRERPRACAEPVLEAFFKLIQLEKLEEGVEMAMDVCAFVGGIEYFALVEEEWACTGMEDEWSDMGMGDEMSYMDIKGEEGRLLWGWKIMRPPPEEPESKTRKLAPRPIY